MTIKDTMMLEKIRREPLEAYMALCLELQPFIARWSRYIHLIIFIQHSERYKDYGMVSYSGRVMVEVPDDTVLADIVEWTKAHLKSDLVAPVTDL